MHSRGFLRPQDEEDVFSSWKVDRSDLDPLKETSFIYNATPSTSIQAQRAKLPISKYRDHIHYLLSQNQTLVVVGETGSGKSTQLPQFLYESVEGIVGITEPRRVAATTLADRVASEVGKPEIVGYSVRFDDRSRNAKIKYMTEGILIREMMGDPLLSDYSILIVDEAHERTVHVDILMGLLKKILNKRKDLKLIVSSATVDAEFIRDFFDNSAILTVEGSSYSVDVFYLTNPCPDYVKECAETAVKVHAIETPGDILIFLTGMEEVERCTSFLKEYEVSIGKSKHGLSMSILPMHGSLPYMDQLKVFRPSQRGLRKIIVATNIAETSITIEGIVYVIDSCFVKLKWYNPETNIDSLIVTEVSQASAEQRSGRAGRTRPGKCYRLCTESDFMKLRINTPPEMQRTDLASTVLQLKALGIDNIVKFEFPSAPPSKNLISGLELLFALGAIDEKGSLTSPLGERMSEFPIHPNLSKMLLTSEDFDCSQEICAIVAMLQVEEVFIKKSSNANDWRIAKRNFEVSEGDLLTLLNVFNAFKKENESRGWCQSHFLKYKVLRRASELYDRLIKTLKRYKIPIKSTTDTQTLLKCIVSGLFPNAAYLHVSGSYRTVRGNIELSIHPTSVLYTVKQPSWVVFTELTETNKTYMKDITVIEPGLLETLAPHYYEKTTLPPNNQT